jgi:hypothetical protein
MRYDDLEVGRDHIEPLGGAATDRALRVTCVAAPAL